MIKYPTREDFFTIKFSVSLRIQWIRGLVSEDCCAVFSTELITKVNLATIKRLEC